MDIGIIVLIAVSAFGTGMGGIPFLRLGRRRYNALEFVLFCLRIAAVLAAAAVGLGTDGGPGTPFVQMPSLSFLDTAGRADTYAFSVNSLPLSPLMSGGRNFPRIRSNRIAIRAVLNFLTRFSTGGFFFYHPRT